MPIKTYKVNHERAWCYFKALGLIPIDAKKNEWCLHHKDQTLKSIDPQRYNEWRFEDLVPMLKSEHTQLHATGHKKTDEQRKAQSERMLGHAVSEETRKKISATQKGRTIPDEVIQKRVETYKKNHQKHLKEKELKTPDEKGKFWITNGVENKRIAENAEIPAGWHRGRLGFVRKSNPKLGIMTEEHKKKISDARKGIKFTEEHRRHLSESHKKTK